MTYVMSWKKVAASVSGVLGIAGLTWAAFRTFVAQIFADGFVNGDVVSLLISISLIALCVGIFFLVKDVVDSDEGGEGFTKVERKRALNAFGVAALLLVAGWAAGTYMQQSFALSGPVQNQFNETKCWWTGGTSEYSAITVADDYVILGSPSNGDNTQFQMWLNQTGFTSTFIKSLRGFNLTFDDDGITQVIFSHYDSGTTEHTILLDSDDGDITVTDLGTTSTINATWGYTTALTLMGYDYAAPDCHFYFTFVYGSDLDDTSAHVFKWYWQTSIGTDWAIMILSVCWIGAGVYNIIIMSNIIGFTKSKYVKYKYSKKKRS